MEKNLVSFLLHVHTILLLTSVVVQATCPATLASDGKWYISITQADDGLLNGCQYGYSAPTDDTTDSVLGDFECGGDCQGSVVNPNYIFWNKTAHDWQATPPCQPLNDTFSCVNLSDDLFCLDVACGNGVFKCHYSDSTMNSSSFCGGTVTSPSSPLPACPGTVSGTDELRTFFASEGNVTVSVTGMTETDYTVITDYRSCQGYINYTFDYDAYCPPKVVSSLDEAQHYCVHGGVVSGGNWYQCDFYDQTGACQGSIDASLQVPACHIANISSCDDNDYFSTCDYGYNYDPDMPASSILDKHCAGSSFSCWDKVDQQWCQGTVIPTYGNASNPVCPSAMTSCDDFERYGIDHNDCSCFDFVGSGGFECGSDWDDPYCRGEIDANATNVTVTPIVPNNGSPPGVDDDDQPKFPHSEQHDDDDYFANDDAPPSSAAAELVEGDQTVSSYWTTAILVVILVGIGVTLVVLRQRRRQLLAQSVLLLDSEVELALEMTVNYLEQVAQEYSHHDAYMAVDEGVPA